MLVLASKSPRRRELLKIIVPEFVSTTSEIDESVFQVEDPYQLPLVLSEAKAKDVARKFPHDTILASDTIVIFQGEVLGKPKDKEDAERMLHLLSGNAHDVVTAFTILKQGKMIQDFDITKVKFHVLSEKTIKEYIATGSPMDKAGAYGIQDENFHLVESIEGSYYNVMGLPVEKLKKYF